MTYTERIRCYESEKRRLWNECSSTKEYEQKLKELVKKWRI